MPSMAGFTPFREARSCIFRAMAPSVLAMTARSPTRVADHKLIEPSGGGGYGEVWLARNRTTNTLRAVKIVFRDEFEDERPYQREFEGLLKFEPISRSHPSQLAILHVGRDDDAG